ncbi:Zinc finger BED domain-containing protein 5 [Labeo rohita]|uniref:Zinc finger BED domain-containing protein 5 n=1 Tax=Labeo rohita TaxID=84645 RepID=A0ABQ8L5C1_LABRO|nr:Zinc finger BED domain-containing protein 5 [Labeo rohita]
MKPSRMKEHLMKIHPDKADKERSFFQALKEKHGRRVISSLFTRTSSQNDSGLIASYNISLLIAKCGQSFTIGEKLVIPVIKEVISTVMERDPTQVLKSIPLSNDTVARRINEMGADTEEQLCAILRDSPFSLQLDETTTSDNNALLMAYVRYRASDIHCVLHRHNLVAKCISPVLHESLNIAVKAINKIKAHALNDRLFRQLCQENKETFECLLLHTEVCWLSKGNCLARFCELFYSIVEYLEKVDAALGERMSSSRCDIMYLTDFFEKMNEATLKLQGKDVTLVQCKAVIHSLTSRLDLYRQSIGRRHFAHFPQLTKASNSLTTTETDEVK